MVYDRNKYKIILFKNGIRTKVFFSSNNKQSILSKYNKLIKEKKPKFITEYISRKKVMFELGVVTTQSSTNEIFSKDEIGRTKKITLGILNIHSLKWCPTGRKNVYMTTL